MKTLNVFDKLFVSVTFADKWRDLLRKWDDVWVTAAFAEGGIYPEHEDSSDISGTYCEFGDIACFMTRNA
jgi:hypothetical protein